jgi:molybdopterin-guanine dinucleotide biosynthesis protein A
MFDIPCIIFAGGKSSRMGEDKALLPFGDFTTLSEFQYSRLSKIFSNVYISCREKEKFAFDAKFILDRTETYAPTAGFIASFQALQSDTIFVMSVDAPFISEDVIKRLINEDKSSSHATIAKTSINSHPLCGIYHKTLYKKFLKMEKENNHKLGYLLKNFNVKYVDFEDESLFANLNHPNEYQEALKRI